MRFLVLILALTLSACASHRQSPPAAAEPATESHCAEAIQSAEVKMNAVDFNGDRKAEVRQYIANARAEQAARHFDKCIGFAEKAIGAS